MAYNTKNIVRDAAGAPIPQYYNPTADEYQVLQGRNGANRVEIYGPDGNPIGTTSGKLNVRASEIETILTTIQGYVDGLEASLGATSDAEATGNGSTIAILKRLRTLLNAGLPSALSSGGGLKVGVVDALPAGANIIGQVKVSDGTDNLGINTDGSVNVQLTGSSIQDSQAVPMTQAQKDIAMRAYENIIDIIGLENIVALFPMWETSGNFKCLIRPYVQLMPNGVVRGQSGLLHPMPVFDGVNDNVLQAPFDSNITGSSKVDLTSDSVRASQKLKTLRSLGSGEDLSFVSLLLSKTGSPTGNVIVDIYEDSSGVPGTLIASSSAVDISNITTSQCWIGFNFSSTISWDISKTYHIVLRYSSVTVDNSNYVSWYYDSAGGYGLQRCFYDGANWSTQTGSHCFANYNKRLDLPQDYSILVACKPSTSTSITEPKGIFTTNHGLGESYCNSLCAEGTFYSNSLPFYWRANATDYIYPASYICVQRVFAANEFSIIGVTHSYSASTKKLITYANGREFASKNGTANSGGDLPAHPFTIGSTYNLGFPISSSYFSGSIGSVIITNNVLTQAQIAKITNQLLALRRRPA